VVKSVVQPVVVTRSLVKVNVAIYNEAGEIVKHLFSYVDDPSGVKMTDVVLSSTVIKPGAGAPTGQPTSLQISVMGTGGAPVSLSWDGTSDNGAVVTTGHYQLEVTWNDGMGGLTEITRGILVSGGNLSAGILAQPNILGPGTTTTLFTASAAGVSRIRAQIYTVAGEWVAKVEGAPGSAQAAWDAQGLASGLYFARVEAFNLTGGLVQSQTLELVLIH
jgi:hypothetical protein